MCSVSRCRRFIFREQCGIEKGNVEELREQNVKFVGLQAGAWRSENFAYSFTFSSTVFFISSSFGMNGKVM